MKERDNRYTKTIVTTSLRLEIIGGNSEVQKRILSPIIRRFLPRVDKSVVTAGRYVHFHDIINMHKLEFILPYLNNT